MVLWRTPTKKKVDEEPSSGRIEGVNSHCKMTSEIFVPPLENKPRFVLYRILIKICTTLRSRLKEVGGWVWYHLKRDLPKETLGIVDGTATCEREWGFRTG